MTKLPFTLIHNERMEVIEPPNPKRPKQVIIAVWLMVFSGAIFLVKAAFLQDWRDPWSYLVTPLLLGIVLVWIYPILRRQNWARWLVSIGTFLCCMQAVGSLRRLNWENWEMFSMILALVDTVASWAKVFFLFSKPAIVWFSKKSPPKSEEPTGNLT